MLELIAVLLQIHVLYMAEDYRIVSGDILFQSNKFCSMTVFCWFSLQPKSYILKEIFKTLCQAPYIMVVIQVRLP